MNDLSPDIPLPAEVKEAFKSASISAIQEFMQLDARSVEPAPATVPSARDSIVAVMRLQRPIPGTLTLVLPPEVARRLAEAFLPPGTAMTDEIVRDVAGELCNVIAGQAKTILKESPYHFKLTIPTVTLHEQQAEMCGIPIAIAIDADLILLCVALGDLPVI